jgi:hypothetical protein
MSSTNEPALQTSDIDGLLDDALSQAAEKEG